MSLHRRTAIAALLKLLVGGSLEGRDRRRAVPSETHVLAMTVVGAVQLPATARRGMLAEATRIWRQEGVSVMWSSDPADGPGLRVVFVQAELRSPASEHRFAIAEFHRAQPRIVGSLGAAGRAVTAAMTRSGAWWLAQQHDHALGLVLGRVLAHEIGHYLLGTAEHSRRGLMRASFPGGSAAWVHAVTG
jgi:hypothetical protein